MQIYQSQKSGNDNDSTIFQCNACKFTYLIYRENLFESKKH